MENRKRAGDYGKREIVRYFTVKGTLFIKGEALLTIFPHQRMIEWYLFHENRVKVPQKKTTRHVSDLHRAAIVTIYKRHAVYKISPLILPMLL